MPFPPIATAGKARLGPRTTSTQNLEDQKSQPGPSHRGTGGAASPTVAPVQAILSPLKELLDSATTQQEVSFAGRVGGCKFARGGCVKASDSGAGLKPPQGSCTQNLICSACVRVQMLKQLVAAIADVEKGRHGALHAFLQVIYRLQWHCFVQSLERARILASVLRSMGS